MKRAQFGRRNPAVRCWPPHRRTMLAAPPTLRTGGIPTSTLPGREPAFSPGEEADMLAIARAQSTMYTLA